jgi:integrase
MRWQATKYPGVRYREHPTRKHGVQKDKYYVIRYKIDGKSKEEALGWASAGWNESKAAETLAKIKSNIRTGEGPRSLEEQRIKATAKQVQSERDAMTFDDAWMLYEKSATKSSIVRDAQNIRLWINPVIGQIPLNKVSAFHLEKIRSTMTKAGRAPRTIHLVLANVRAIINFCIKRGLFIGMNPVKSIAIKTYDNKRVRYLTIEEANALLIEVKKRSVMTWKITMLSLLAGLRFGEIAGLKWKDMGTDTITILDPKNSRTRHAYINATIAAIFNDMERGKPEALVFPDRCGNRRAQVSDAFNRAVNQLGLNDGITDRRQRLCFHSVRHSFASWLALEGADLLVIKELLGHRDLTTTQRYAHLSPGKLRSAAEGLEKIFTSGKSAEASQRSSRDRGAV